MQITDHHQKSCQAGIMPAMPSACRRYIIDGESHIHKRSGLNYVLYGITAAYVILYIISLWFNSWRLESLHVNPMAGPSAHSLVRLGAAEHDAVVNKHQWWRIIAAPFLCAGAC